MNIRLGVGDLLLKIIYILCITHIFTDIMQELNTCQNTSGICISFCASMRKNVLGVLFCRALPCGGRELGGGWEYYHARIMGEIYFTIY